MVVALFEEWSPSTSDIYGSNTTIGNFSKLLLPNSCLEKTKIEEKVQEWPNLFSHYLIRPAASKLARKRVNFASQYFVIAFHSSFEVLIERFVKIWTRQDLWLLHHSYTLLSLFVSNVDKISFMAVIIFVQFIIYFACNREKEMFHCVSFNYDGVN